MIVKLISRTIGTMLVADGLCALISPTKYPRRLEIGTPMIDDMLEFCAENPTFTRALSAIEIGLGAWLTLR